VTAQSFGMLELRPTCENCDVELPPASIEAMICSFECTFCRDCVERLDNVCPNCGGGFSPRPVRPATNWKGENYLGTYPAATTRRYSPVDVADHRALHDRVGSLSPERR
jgi:uncharacterized protein